MALVKVSTSVLWSNLSKVEKRDYNKNLNLVSNCYCSPIFQVNVSCLPLYSILMAFNNPTIDYFSLDVEGSELAILKTIPFDKVDIRVSLHFHYLMKGINFTENVMSNFCTEKFKAPFR
jgi:hypothetical protein